MFQETSQGVLLKIKVIPKASKSEIVGWEGNELKIRLSAVPDKGKANEELIRFLALYFHHPKSRIDIVSGETSRHKKVCFLGKKIAELQKLLDI